MDKLFQHVKPLSVVGLPDSPKPDSSEMLTHQPKVTEEQSTNFAFHGIYFYVPPGTPSG